jgi:hypothetical protein
MRTALLFLFFALLSSAGAHAQDLLTKRNGDEFTVKIIEITPTEVKYRRTDNPDGPLITVWKSEVFMIRYANGSKDVFGNSLTTVPAPTAPAPAKPGDFPILPEPIHLDGPRVGFTVLSAGVVDKAKEQGTDVSPFITQFGWQFESQLFRLPNGVSALVELVPLVGGLEQGLFIPSISGIIGMRGAKGFEFGIGPNVTPLGASVVLALGTSFHSNGINFPLNLAVVPGKDGLRTSLVLGFNARHH